VLRVWTADPTDGELRECGLEHEPALASRQ